VVADVAGKRSAERCADADEGADNPLSEVEVPSAAREIGYDKRHHDAEHSGSHAVEELHDDQQPGICHRCEKNAANRESGEADKQ
jgi:hypothetical protein